MSDEKMQSKIAYIFGRRKSWIVIEGKAEDGETTVVRCTDGKRGYMAVFRKDDPLPQIYARVE